MTIIFSQLQNYIQNDPLSDWFERINRKYTCYEKTNKTSFEIELKDKKFKYKEDGYNPNYYYPGWITGNVNKLVKDYPNYNQEYSMQQPFKKV